MRDIKKKLDQIQEISLNIYGKYDLNKSIIWMVEELGEVISAIRKESSPVHITEEIGDLLAWIFNLANILGLKVSDAIESTYKKEIKRQLRVYGKIKYDKANIIHPSYFGVSVTPENLT